MIKILLTKDIDPPESSTDLAWISRAGIVALRICSHAVFWGRVPTPTFFTCANKLCSYVWWSQIIDFRLQTNNRSTVHACQGMTTNQTEHSTVVGTAKVNVSYFHLFCILFVIFSQKPVPFKMAMDQNWQCSLPGVSDTLPVPIWEWHWHWCKQWLDDPRLKTAGQTSLRRSNSIISRFYQRPAGCQEVGGGRQTEAAYRPSCQSRPRLPGSLLDKAGQCLSSRCVVHIRRWTSVLLLCLL